MFINFGSLVGGIAIPLIAQYDVTVAYFIPAGTMTLAIIIFLLGSSRYVKMKPNGKSLVDTFRVIGSSLKCNTSSKSCGCMQGMEPTKVSKGGRYPDYFVDGVKSLLTVLPITSLIIPFAVVYSQMVSISLVVVIMVLL